MIGPVGPPHTRLRTSRHRYDERSAVSLTIGSCGGATHQSRQYGFNHLEQVRYVVLGFSEGAAVIESRGHGGGYRVRGGMFTARPRFHGQRWSRLQLSAGTGHLRSARRSLPRSASLRSTPPLRSRLAACLAIHVRRSWLRVTADRPCPRRRSQTPPAMPSASFTVRTSDVAAPARRCVISVASALIAIPAAVLPAERHRSGVRSVTQAAPLVRTSCMP